MEILQNTTRKLEGARSSDKDSCAHNQPVLNISTTVNQNIIIQQNTSIPTSSSPHICHRPRENRPHTLIDLTLIDDSDVYSSSDTEVGSTSEDVRFDENDYLDDDQLETLLQCCHNEYGIQALTPAAHSPATISLREYNGLEVGMSVKLIDGNLMRIKHILRRFNGDIHLRGLYFKELTNLQSPFPEREREVCWLIEQDADGVIYREKEVLISAVLTTSNIALTNSPMQTHSSMPFGSYICRLLWQSTPEKGEFIVRNLTFDEADDDYATPPSVIRRQWRGETTPFGSELKKSGVSPERKYSFGDAFCGAGGVTLGASMAGLLVKYGVDIDKAACETWRTNFLHSWCYHADFFSWLSLHDDEEMKVDISHSSPPCQPFSPAHTRSYNQQRDDENSSLIFSAFNMLKKVKPRIHTIEETFGVPSRHKETFSRMIQDILELGYSIHAKIVSCEKYGVPQSRKRLFIIAAGPGEKLPAFPTPTHGTGLRPYVTIKDVISRIPRSADNHDIMSTIFPEGMSRVPYDENSLAKTITCGGGEKNYHPSGLRHFTIRELASLQTYHPLYKFPTSYAKKQIGNSVPPRLAEVIYRAAIKSLQETDEEELRQVINID